MTKPTGKLKHAYETITNMERVINTQKEELEQLKKENRKLKLIIDEGLGAKDLERDI